MVNQTSGSIKLGGGGGFLTGGGTLLPGGNHLTIRR